MPRKYVVVRDVTVLRSTEKAGLFQIDDEEHWIPWSQVSADSVDRDGATGDLVITEWIANERGIEFEEGDD